MGFDIVSTLRIFLGLVFVFSGVGKIVDIEAFSEIVRAYNLLPDSFVFHFSLLLSCVEILFCMLFILKIWIRFASFVLLFLSVLFLFILIYGIYFVGIDECGCFGKFFDFGSGILNLLKTFILAFLVFVYVWLEKLYEFKFLAKFLSLSFLIFALIFSIVGVRGEVIYGFVDLSFLDGGLDADYYLLVIFSPLDCSSCFRVMVPVWNMIDSLYRDRGLRVLGLTDYVDDRLVNYFVNAYSFRFKVLKLRKLEIDISWTPCEILVDRFGRVYYKFEGIKPAKAHVNGLLKTINKILKQNYGG